MNMKKFTDEEINEIAERFPMIGENFDGHHWVIDEDYNHWLYLDHTHNVVKISYVAWVDDDFKTLNEVRVGLTGEFEDDIKYGIKKVLSYE